MNISELIKTMGIAAQEAAKAINNASTGQKNTALEAIACEIIAQRENLMAENKKDLINAEKNNIGDALLDRLKFTPARFDSMIEGLRQVAALEDPVGEITDLAYQPSGIQVGKMRVPLGVIGIIYESRPNVTIDAASLCLKSGNATILRGGSEAIHSNKALAKCIQRGLEVAGLPADVVQLVPITDREAVGKLITLKDYVDIIVPRGGDSLIERVSREASIPVIKHLDGICHVFIDDQVDRQMAIDIAFNAKCNRYAVCNAMETLLIAESQAQNILPELTKMYLSEGVELRVCEKTAHIVSGLVSAVEEDWKTEYVAAILSIKIVKDLDEAIEHINHYGSKHTDTIVTDSYKNSIRFLREVDSSSVIVNASTRFADGFEFGLGAEVGISTDKLHARGPVGLEGLTSQKYVVLGTGQIRQ